MKDKSLFISTIIFFVFYIFLAVVFFSPFKTVFTPFAATAAFVYFFSPMVGFLNRKGLGIKLSATIVYVTIIVLLLLGAVFAFPKIYVGVMEVIKILSDSILKNSLSGEMFTKGASAIYSTAMSAVRLGAVVLVSGASAFYILTDKAHFVASLSEIVPTKLKPGIRIMLDDAKSIVDKFFKGQLIVAFLLFVIETVFLYAVGVPYALGLGAIAGILDIVPYAGAFIAFGITILVTALSSPEKLIVVIIGLLIIQQIENNIITPKVSSDTLDLHPALVVLVVYIGSFGGFWGILLSVPFACILKKLGTRFIQSMI